MVKIVFLILVSMLNLCKVYSQRIEDCLRLNISVVTDTVQYGDSLQLNVFFKNVTNNKYTFYPMARLVLEKKEQRKAFGVDYDKSYIVNSEIDLNFTQSLSPNAIYETKYSIFIDPGYFLKGENVFYLCYLFRPKWNVGFKRKYLKKSSLLGVLRSNMFIIYVK